MIRASIAVQWPLVLSIFYWHFLVFMMELLPEFWTWDLETHNIGGQWYKDVPQERIFGSHPHSQLQAQKGVARVDLEALLLTLEYYVRYFRTYRT